MNGVLAFAFVVPTHQLWLVILLLGDAFGLALVIAFMRPRALMPTWLKEEIDRGVVGAAVPHRADWIYFWMLVPIVLLANLGIPWLVFSLHANETGLDLLTRVLL